MEKEYCVYVHTNKTNGKRYVGITCQKPEMRWKQGYSFNEHFANAIAKYGWEGFKHEVIASGLSKEAACDMEIALIAKWKCTDPMQGYNIQSGGQCSAEQNNIAVNQYSLDGKYIKTWASMKEAAASFGTFYLRGTQIGMACAGKLCSTAHGYMWRYANGDNSDIEPYKSNRYRQVAQYDINGDLVKAWGNIKDAAESLGIDNTSITHVCKGRFRTAGGYVWRYCDDIIPLKIDKTKPYKKGVSQFTKTGCHIRDFESVQEAVRFLGIVKNGDIIKCCKGKKKSAHGYIWRYNNAL